MKIIESEITISELKIMAEKMFGNLVKAVVDIDKGLMAVDAELHADEEAILIEHGSKQKDLWGINLYPQLTGEDFIEFDSMINLRPSQGNLTRSVENEEIRKKIKIVVNRLIKR
ncbi:hypothetical protein A3H09_01305 [Candidatus Falkowbacteria bacterium RIFCSPLOWO2_12_FULL_45_13]|uniref:Uncharacterized protein n=1 Tax=Candidatus Falkowbacteria bacterium RIFCSPLOWO2_12_FULL_45_13 TaxID=1797991 RepID=A0A1F5SZ99_9BACT|nr:MAG: hypothetical protein A3H09_01305 [Candidatus Falkowbacteria bacterium RIFCSPLOWO2_12_FULL_45_13]